MKLKRKSRVVKNKVGRPKLPVDQKQRYQRVALYPKTYDRIKRLAAEEDERIIDWVEDMVPK